MNRFVDEDQGTQEYRHMSLASHIGLDSMRGHYIAFNVVQCQWWKFGEDSVKTFHPILSSMSIFLPGLFHAYALSTLHP
jgi:hypothetical protein